MLSCAIDAVLYQRISTCSITALLHSYVKKHRPPRTYVELLEEPFALTLEVVLELVPSTVEFFDGRVLALLQSNGRVKSYITNPHDSRYLRDSWLRSARALACSQCGLVLVARRIGVGWVGNSSNTSCSQRTEDADFVLKRRKFSTGFGANSNRLLIRYG